MHISPLINEIEAGPLYNDGKDGDLKLNCDTVTDLQIVLAIPLNAAGSVDDSLEQGVTQIK